MAKDALKKKSRAHNDLQTRKRATCTRGNNNHRTIEQAVSHHLGKPIRA